MASSDPAVALEVPEEVEVDTRTGLTPRFSCATALVPEAGPPPTLTLPAAMKRVHSVGGLSEAPKSAKFLAADDAPTARSRASSHVDDDLTGAGARARAEAPAAEEEGEALFALSEAATRTGFTPEKPARGEAEGGGGDCGGGGGGGGGGWASDLSS